MAELTPRSVVLGSGDATFLEAGSTNSQTVLLMHGGGLDCASLSWRFLIPELSADYRVVAPNWPGYAGTAPFGRPYTIADIGRWLIAFLDHLEIESASMIGISMGGGAALWTAINHPTRVNYLVPVGTYGVADRAPHHLLSYLLTKLPLNSVSYAVMRRFPNLLRRAVEAIFAKPEKVTPEIIAEVQDVLRAAGRGAPFSNFQRGEMTPTRLRSVFTSELQDVSNRTLFIHGKEDSLVPLKVVELTASSMRNACLEVMDAGHWPMRECPEQFNELVVSFLNGVNH